MTAPNPHRGGLPVGHLSDLDPVGAGAVLCLRLWCDGPAGRTALRTHFHGNLGPRAGRHALEALDTLCDQWIRHARRPPMRHDVTCACLGADEAIFANFVAFASEGDREDAMLIATTLVRADMAALLVTLAGEVGLALARIARPPETERWPDTVLH